MTSATKNVKTRDQLEAMVAHSLGVGLADGDSVQELTQGWFNAAYRLRLDDGRETVLKIAPPPDVPVMAYERGMMATEVEVMRLVASDPSVPVPTVLAYDASREVCDADHFFMSVLSGDNLDLVKESLPAAELASIRRRIGEIVRSINAFTGPWFGCPGNPDLRGPTWRVAFERIMESVLSDAQARSADCGVSHDRVRVLLDRHGAALEEVTTPCLVHWDAWDPNWFVRDGDVVGLLDFERALWADPLMEAQFRTFGGPVNEAMRGYGRTTFTAAEERRCQLYTLHLGLVMNTECSYRNYGNDDIWNMSRGITAMAIDALEAE